jgi:hypothetical protein
MLSDHEFSEIMSVLVKFEATHDDVVSLRLLQTHAETFAYLAERERAEGGDEALVAEVVCRMIPLNRGDVREIVRTLRPLGYDLMCDRLVEILPVLKPARRQLSLRERGRKVLLAHRRAKARRASN